MKKLFITTAITYEGHYRYGDRVLREKREQQYKDFIKEMGKYDLPKFYCECVHLGPETFLDKLVPNIFYSQTHNKELHNQGVDEIMAWKAAIKHFCFSDDDMIIKLTGRYIPMSSYLFDSISNEFDAFFYAFPEGRSGYGQVFTGAFGIRCRLLRQYIDNVDHIKLEKEMINIETDMYRFLQSCNNIKYLDRLDMKILPGGGEGMWVR